MRAFLKRGAIVVASFGLVAPGADAASLNFFTSFWAFGDSLSDDGNLFRATGGAVPAAPYADGRFSNGPVWTEAIAGDFAAERLGTGNFAHGMANAVPLPGRPVSAPPVVDLPGQIALFEATSAGRLGRRGVASLWFGANDLFFFGIPTGQAAAVGAAAANAVADGALALRDLGVRDVMLFNLPALDRTPAYALVQTDLAAQARIGTEAFNAALGDRIPGLESAGLNVIAFDMFGLFNQLIDDPQAFGVADATTPCFIPLPGFEACPDEVAPALAFFDWVHPNSVIHSQIAGRVRERVAPVPLPAPAVLLLVALAGLGLVGRRGRAA